MSESQAGQDGQRIIAVTFYCVNHGDILFIMPDDLDFESEQILMKKRQQLQKQLSLLEQEENERKDVDRVGFWCRILKK